MKKNIIFICLIILLSGCSNKSNTNIIVNSKSIEYGNNIMLSDIVTITDGQIKENQKIDTLTLGNKNITFQYLDNKKDIKTHNFNINIVDETKPVIISSKNFYTKKGTNIDFNKRIVCGDNYDRNLKCSVVGNYDINKSGEYKLKFVATDSNNNTSEKEFTLIVKDKLDDNNYDDEYYNLKDFIKAHKTDETLIGIDVSTWQGNINWDKVKSAGVSFVIIRVGFGHDDDRNLVFDKKFETNLKNAKAAGIKVGVYFYSYAITKEESLEQAKWIIKALNKQKLDLPIAFDWEDWSEFNNYNLNFVDLNTIANTFMDEIKNNGYEAMLYGSANYLRYVWDTDKYPVWLAHYTDKTSYEKEYYIWQATNLGKVDGINGYVDLNVLYEK